jgi:hypothetical protein
MVLQGHPRLQGHPSDLARFIRETDPSFEGVKGSNVSIAYSKLRRRFGDFFDPKDLHADQYHVEEFVLADDGERVCPVCGTTSGYQMPHSSTPLGEGLKGQNSFVNPLHRVFRTSPIRMKGTTYGMISKAAMVRAEFGNGVEGRLIEKGLVIFEELCKSNRRDELPQEVTSQMARMVEAECKTRAKGLKEAGFDGAKEAVITSCMKAMEEFPHHQQTLKRMVLAVSANFPDLLAKAGGRRGKSKSSFDFEEEERTFRQVEKEEWQELHPRDLTNA